MATWASPTIFATLSKKKVSHCGFTLAEVLITLTIIGVIAAITIPTLIKNYEKRQIEVGLAKTYQELNNIIKRSEVDNGPFEDWEFKGSVLAQYQYEYINKYFGPYMSLKPCNNNCFSGIRSGYFGAYRYPNGTLQPNTLASYYLPDGRYIAFEFSYYQEYMSTNWAKYIIFVVDVNGSRGKSIMGEDVFWFFVGYSKNKFPIKGLYAGDPGSGYGYNQVSKDKLYSLCAPNQAYNSLKQCSIILQRNNWKFPDDYPIKF